MGNHLSLLSTTFWTRGSVGKIGLSAIHRHSPDNQISILVDAILNIFMTGGVAGMRHCFPKSPEAGLRARINHLVFRSLWRPETWTQVTPKSDDLARSINRLEFLSFVNNSTLPLFAHPK